MENSTNWSAAQVRERHYYETRADSHAKIDQVYAHFHAPLWQGILSRLREIDFHDDGYYVDVGCGPNPILAFVEKGTRLGIDPLMPFYQERFVFPPGVEVHEGTIEELAPVPDGRADIIFSMNNIDHIKDIQSAVKTLRRKLNPTGYLVISVNIVLSSLARYLSKSVDIYRFVDPTHTYHFHSPEEVAAQLDSHFELVRYECIEALLQDMSRLKEEQDKQASTLRGSIRRALKYLKNDILLREDLYLLLFRAKPEV